MYSDIKINKKIYKFFRLIFHKFTLAPKDITVEISTKCSLECKMCFRSPLGVKDFLMPFEIFKDVSFGKIDYLTFVGLGEIFCHDQLACILLFAKQMLPYTRIEISTNLTHFNEPLLQKIIKDKIINQISISVDDINIVSPFYHIFSQEIAT